MTIFNRLIFFNLYNLFNLAVAWREFSPQGNKDHRLARPFALVERWPGTIDRMATVSAQAVALREF